MKLLLGILVAASIHVGDPPHLDDVVRGLARLETGRNSTAVRAELVDLGPGAVPALLHVLGGRPVEGAAGPPVLDTASRTLLVEALRELPSGRVSRELLGRALGEDPAEQRTAWTLVAELGDVVIVLDLLEACSLADPNEPRNPRLESALERAMRSALRRDPRAIGRLDTRLMRVPDAVLPPVVRALGRARSFATTPLLVGLLGRAGELDFIVLGALGEENRASCADDETRAAVRSYAGSGDPRVRRLAVGTLGNMRDATAADEVVEYLDAGDRGLARASREALSQMSGLDLGPDRAPWARWLADQRRWRSEHGSALEASAVGGEPEAAMRAIRALSSRPFFAREHSRALARALAHADEGVAAAAAAGLERLGVGDGLERLVDALDDPRPRVSAAARRALRSLTGGLHEPDELAWRDVLPR